VRDVLISGGDPLALSDDRLGCDPVAPPVDPSHRVRADRDQDAGSLAAAHYAGIVHSTAPLSSALDEPAFRPSRRMHARVQPGLRPVGGCRIPLGSQTVLLQGVNDNVRR